MCGFAQCAAFVDGGVLYGASLWLGACSCGLSGLCCAFDGTTSHAMVFVGGAPRRVVGEMAQCVVFGFVGG